MRALESAGFTRICIGLEDPSSYILNKVNKPTRFHEFCEALAIVKKTTSIKTVAYAIFGLPGSTPQSIKDFASAICALVENKAIDEVYDAIFVPQVGSDIFNNPKKYGVSISGQRQEQQRRESSKPAYRLNTINTMNLERGLIQYKKDLVAAYKNRYT
jgi:radical SAM superfamily enzyme YgiQ (UPF0313 family)